MSEKLEQLLENILTEIKTLNQNVRELKEKDELETLVFWFQILRGTECLWDGKYAPLLREKEEKKDALYELQKKIIKKILKLAPNIKS